MPYECEVSPSIRGLVHKNTPVFWWTRRISTNCIAELTSLIGYYGIPFEEIIHILSILVHVITLFGRCLLNSCNNSILNRLVNSISKISPFKLNIMSVISKMAINIFPKNIAVVIKSFIYPHCFMIISASITWTI